MNKLIQLWLTNKFPSQHIKSILVYSPKGTKNKLRNVFRTWIVHPVKRRVSRLYLAYLRKYFNIKVIGITGSAGKTTTKEMLASILKSDGEVVYSAANIDPVYNIPTTILKCRPSTKYLVLEMGIEYPGEMDFYLWLVTPDVGIVTNIYPTHTLYLGSVDGVAREKSKLLELLPVGSTAVIGTKNSFFKRIVKNVKARTITFGLDGEFQAHEIRLTQSLNTNFTLIHRLDSIYVHLPVLGSQFVENALAAASAASALGLDLSKIKQGLESFKPQEHRMSIRKIKNSTVLIDDTYNSNPEAVKKAIETLLEVRGDRKTIFIFGDMLELGADEIKYHKEIGELFSKSKIDYVVGVGPLSKFVVQDKKLWSKDWNEAVQIVKPLLKKNLLIFVKGSRSIGLDNLVKALT